MILVLIGLIVCYPIELVDVTGGQGIVVINYRGPFTISLDSNKDFDRRSGWKTVETYKLNKFTHTGPLYIRLPNKIDQTRYYAYRLSTPSGIYFTKAFFYDKYEGFIMTSEFDEEPRLIKDRSKKKEEEKTCTHTAPKEEKSFNDLAINICILVFIILLVCIILFFSTCCL